MEKRTNDPSRLLGFILNQLQAPGFRFVQRKNVTVKLSYDEGKTWPVARSVEPGISGYSDLAAGPDGFAYCFYERGSVDTSHYRPAQLTVARFNLEWLTDGRDHFE